MNLLVAILLTPLAFFALVGIFALIGGGVRHTKKWLHKTAPSMDTLSNVSAQDVPPLEIFFQKPTEACL